jgi:hypothetical protein
MKVEELVFKFDEEVIGKDDSYIHSFIQEDGLGCVIVKTYGESIDELVFQKRYRVKLEEITE